MVASVTIANDAMYAENDGANGDRICVLEGMSTGNCCDAVRGSTTLVARHVVHQK
jgi:hypothetical protein